jgi:iron(III) transport system ATP-binding protein
VHLHLRPEPPGGERNVWPVTIRRAVFLGDLTQAHVDWGGRELVVRHTAIGLREGQQAFLSADPGQCVLLEGDA